MRRLAATAAAGGGTITMRGATDMRHKALPLPGQLALDFAAAEGEPGLAELGCQTYAGTAETAGRPARQLLLEPRPMPRDGARDALP